MVSNTPSLGDILRKTGVESGYKLAGPGADLEVSGINMTKNY